MDPLSIATSVGVGLFLMYIGWRTTQTANMGHKMNDLHDWHSVTDSDGVKVWYMKSSLEKIIEKLSDNVDKQTAATHALSDNVKDQSRDLRELKGMAKEIKSVVTRSQRGGG